MVVKSCLTEQPRIQGDNQYFSVEGFFVKTKGIVRYIYGNCLKITGTLKKRPIGRIYSQYYLIPQEINKIPLIEVRQNNKNVFHAFLYTIYSRIIILRSTIQKIYYHVFPSPQAQLLAGIVLGTKED